MGASLKLGGNVQFLNFRASDNAHAALKYDEHTMPLKDLAFIKGGIALGQSENNSENIPRQKELIAHLPNRNRGILYPNKEGFGIHGMRFANFSTAG